MFSVSLPGWAQLFWHCTEQFAQKCESPGSKTGHLHEQQACLFFSGSGRQRGIDHSILDVGVSQPVLNEPEIRPSTPTIDPVIDLMGRLVVEPGTKTEPATPGVAILENPAEHKQGIMSTTQRKMQRHSQLRSDAYQETFERASPSRRQGVHSPTQEV